MTEVCPALTTLNKALSDKRLFVDAWLPEFSSSKQPGTYQAQRSKMYKLITDLSKHLIYFHLLPISAELVQQPGKPAVFCL